MVKTFNLSLLHHYYYVITIQTSQDLVRAPSSPLNPSSNLLIYRNGQIYSSIIRVSLLIQDHYEANGALFSIAIRLLRVQICGDGNPCRCAEIQRKSDVIKEHMSRRSYHEALREPFRHCVYLNT